MEKINTGSINCPHFNRFSRGTVLFELDLFCVALCFVLRRLIIFYHAILSSPVFKAVER